MSGAVRFVSSAFSRQRRQSPGIMRRTSEPCVRQNRVVLTVVATVKLFAEAAFASTGAVSANFAEVREARTNSAPGRARHKPSNHCAGKAVCSASPVCRCAVFLRVHSHSGPQILDCFAALAMTMWRRRATLHHRHPEVRALRRISAVGQASKGDGPAASRPCILRGSRWGASRPITRTSG